MNLVEMIQQHTARGECNCGKCFDRGTKPDPVGLHTADVEFFKVALVGTPTMEQFKALTAEHRGDIDCNPFDGAEHSFMELGAWLGDQGLALQYMGLGRMLNAFQLMTPTAMLGANFDAETRKRMAGMGYVTVKASA